MDDSFTRVKSIINRLRDVIKCQKCLQLKKEDTMVYFLSCDHFYCVDCIAYDKVCLLCENTLDPPMNVSKDKNILSLYRSLINFELPSKQKVEEIYNELKELKKAKTGEEEVVDTPRTKQTQRKSLLDKENEKKSLKTNGNETPKAVKLKNKAASSSKVSDGVTPKQVNLKNSTPASSRIATTIRKGERVTTPVSAGSNKGNTSTKGNINKKNPKGETQLHLACKKSNFAAVKELIEAKANPNAQDNAGWTPLHESIFSGNLEIIKYLLDHGGKVNAPGLENTTALHEAIAKGNLAMVKLLLDYGADINAKNIFKETPLDLVTKYKLNEMEGILREAAKNVKNSKVDADFLPEDEEILIYNHNLAIEDEKLVNKFVEKFGAKLIPSITLKDSPTHIVVSKPNFEITWAVISCVPTGCWIVAVDWIKECLRDSCIKPWKKYEVSNSHLSGFKKARENRENLLPGLFSGCHLFFGGKFEHYSLKEVIINKENLKSLVEKQGGILCKRCPDPERSVGERTVPYHADSKSSISETCFYIIYQKDKWDPSPKYNMSHMKTLPVDWLIACLCKYQLVDPNNKTSFCDFL